MNTRYTWTIPGRRGKEGKGEKEKRERNSGVSYREKYLKETNVETREKRGQRFSPRGVHDP